MLDSLRGSSVNIGTMQRKLARPLRSDNTHTSRNVNNSITLDVPGAQLHDVARERKFARTGFALGRQKELALACPWLPPRLSMQKPSRNTNNVTTNNDDGHK